MTVFLGRKSSNCPGATERLYVYGTSVQCSALTPYRRWACVTVCVQFCGHAIWLLWWEAAQEPSRLAFQMLWQSRHTKQNMSFIRSHPRQSGQQKHIAVNHKNKNRWISSCFCYSNKNRVKTINVSCCTTVVTQIWWWPVWHLKDATCQPVTANHVSLRCGSNVTQWTTQLNVAQC